MLTGVTDESRVGDVKELDRGRRTVGASEQDQTWDGAQRLGPELEGGHGSLGQLGQCEST